MKTTIPSLILGTATLLTLGACNEKKETPADTASAPSLGTGYAGDDKVGLDTLIELPKEKIEGSPAPKNIPNLVPRPKKFPEFYVPEGSTNLAKGKTVTSSDDYPILGELTLVTDGDKEADEGCFVELIDGKQWIQIDLEKSAPLHAIVVWHYHAAKRVYHDVIVQTSDDPTFKNGVTTLYNNDYDNSSGMGKGKNRPYVESRYGLLINANGTKARYIRLYSRGSTSSETNNYIEVEVFGKAE